jgi:hypothetical protein
VLVVEGRPRYHVEGCRYLSGKAAEAVDVLDARDEGFSPCGVCKPDDALAAAAQAEPVEEQLDGTVDAEPVVQEDVPGVEVAPARAARKAPARKSPAKKAPAKGGSVTPVRAGTKAVKAVKAPAAKAPGRAAVKATAPAATAPSKAAAAAAGPRAGSVVVIPDRGKFHKGECRFVRGVEGTEAMSKSAASRAGYTACGVCKP